MVYGVRNKNAIKAVQSFLNEEGFTDGKGERLWVDGVYGANTANAMIKYQRANNLVANGVTGDETWNSIYRKKRDREEREEFYKELKEKDGGYFYEKIKSIRKAQRAMGIEPEGVLEGEEEEMYSPDNSVFLNGFGIKGPLTLSTDPSHGVLPIFANPSYKTKEDAFVNSKGNGKAEAYFYESSAEDNVFLNEENTNQNEVALNTVNKSGNDAGVKKVTITEADRNIINDGFYDKAKNVKDFPDSQNVINADYRSYYDFEKTPAKNVLTGKLDDALKTAIANDDSYSQQVIKTTIDNVNSFDDSAITSIYYLNDEDGAMTAGHSGILMVNSEGKGILFSFYPQNQKFPDGLFYAPSEMRISVLSGQGLDNFMNGSTVFAASTSGKKRTESYDRAFQYEITPAQGKAMFEQAVAITGLGFSYDLAYRNCDHIALSILAKGGIIVTKEVLPNESFTGVVEFC